MEFFLKALWQRLGAVALLFMFAAAFYLQPPLIDNAALLTDEAGELLPEPQQIDLPFQSNRSDTQPRYRMTLHYKPHQFPYFRLFVDDCLEEITVNDQLLDLSRVGRNLCDYRRGITVDFSRYLQPGSNTIEIATRNFHAPYGLQIEGHLQRYIGVDKVVFLSLLYGWILWLLQARLDRTVACAAGVAMLLSGTFFMLHDWFEFSYDSDKHAQYIRYIAENLRLPPSGLNHIAPHPPLYYVLMAPLYALGTWLHNDPFIFVRLASIPLFLVFIGSGLKIIQLLVENLNAQRAASLWFLFAWPVAFSMTGRISNDLVFYALCGPFLHQLMQWQRSGEYRYFMRCTVLVAIALANKNNGMLLGGILLAVMAFRLMLGAMTLRFMRRSSFYAALLLVIAACGVNFGRNYLESQHDPKITLLNSFYDYTQPREGFSVQNGWRNYLHLDLQNYLNRPFWNFWDRGYGSDYFWESFFKTLHYGEFFWRSPTLATLINLHWLAVLVFVLLQARVFRMPRRAMSRDPMLVVWCALPVLLGGLVMFRLLYAHSGCAEARYIFPITVLFASLLGRAISEAERHKQSCLVGHGLVKSYCVLSLALVLWQCLGKL